MSTQSPEKDKRSKLMGQENEAKREQQRADQEARNERKRERQEKMMIEKIMQRGKKS